MRSLVYARDTLSGRTIQHFQARVLRSTARQGVGRGGFSFPHFWQGRYLYFKYEVRRKNKFQIFLGQDGSNPCLQTRAPRHSYSSPPLPPPPSFKLKIGSIVPRPNFKENFLQSNLKWFS